MTQSTATTQPTGQSPLTGHAPRADAVRAAAIDAFEALYRVQVRTVMAFFARRSRDPQTVFDLTADTFVEAMRSFASAPPARGNGRPWLLAIARRVYAGHCEQASRHVRRRGRSASRRAP